MRLFGRRATRSDGMWAVRFSQTERYESETSRWVGILLDWSLTLETRYQNLGSGHCPNHEYRVSAIVDPS